MLKIREVFVGVAGGRPKLKHIQLQRAGVQVLVCDEFAVVECGTVIAKILSGVYLIDIRIKL